MAEPAEPRGRKLGQRGEIRLVAEGKRAGPSVALRGTPHCQHDLSEPRHQVAAGVRGPAWGLALSGSEQGKTSAAARCAPEAPRKPCSLQPWQPGTHVQGPLPPPFQETPGTQTEAAGKQPAGVCLEKGPPPVVPARSQPGPRSLAPCFASWMGGSLHMQP